MDIEYRLMRLNNRSARSLQYSWYWNVQIFRAFAAARSPGNGQTLRPFQSSMCYSRMTEFRYSVPSVGACTSGPTFKIQKSKT